MAFCPALQVLVALTTAVRSRALPPGALLVVGDSQCCCHWLLTPEAGEQKELELAEQRMVEECPACSLARSTGHTFPSDVPFFSLLIGGHSLASSYDLINGLTLGTTPSAAQYTFTKLYWPSLHNCRTWSLGRSSATCCQDDIMQNQALPCMFLLTKDGAAIQVVRQAILGSDAGQLLSSENIMVV